MQVMNSIPGMSIQAAFWDLDEPRLSERCTYPLHEVILIAICGTLCGAETWTEIEAFGESKQEWLHTFLALEPGIPSQETFRRVLGQESAQILRILKQKHWKPV